MTEAKKPKETLSYSEASQELEDILADIESGTVDIDVLSKKVERAASLVQTCRDKLVGTELRVTKILEELEGETDEQPDDAD